ncbi:MAG: PDZ domain-containing protein [Phycisphaerales bacterium]|nr:PDZ domain-containing protein [Phycisphaerales bacterium]
MMRSVGSASSVFVCAFVSFLGVSSGFQSSTQAAWMAPPEVSGAGTLAVRAQHGRFGLRLVDLNDVQRRRLERNTGAVVVKVYDDTPAFYANILVDDVIIAVNGEPVGTAADAVTKLRAIDQNAGPATVTVLRRGQEKTITVTFR